ncbi:hypothetical protein KIPB_010203, partial [Kipferlia bialata]
YSPVSDVLDMVLAKLEELEMTVETAETAVTQQRNTIKQIHSLLPKIEAWFLTLEALNTALPSLKRDVSGLEDVVSTLEASMQTKGLARFRSKLLQKSAAASDKKLDGTLAQCTSDLATLDVALQQAKTVCAKTRVIPTSPLDQSAMEGMSPAQPTQGTDIMAMDVASMAFSIGTLDDEDDEEDEPRVYTSTHVTPNSVSTTVHNGVGEVEESEDTDSGIDTPAPAPSAVSGEVEESESESEEAPVPAPAPSATMSAVAGEVEESESSD